MNTTKRFFLICFFILKQVVDFCLPRPPPHLALLFPKQEFPYVSQTRQMQFARIVETVRCHERKIYSISVLNLPTPNAAEVTTTSQPVRLVVRAR